MEIARIRSATMRSVKSRDTAPERVVRSYFHKLGHRFRLHRGDLPGRPDLVFVGPRVAIFVHGCWWHGHECYRGNRIPKTNTAYWTKKIARNIARDKLAVTELERLGWTTIVLWECMLVHKRVLVQAEQLVRARRRRTKDVS